ncbi:MAG: hypothetical protein JWQ35_801 [Bacteriovoracaceae bacterium]|nr:hypothetical protein [Bacteriovoracaceae bacterium]
MTMPMNKILLSALASVFSFQIASTTFANLCERDLEAITNALNRFERYPAKPSNRFDPNENFFQRMIWLKTPPTDFVSTPLPLKEDPHITKISQQILEHLVLPSSLVDSFVRAIQGDLEMSDSLEPHYRAKISEKFGPSIHVLLGDRGASGKTSLIAFYAEASKRKIYYVEAQGSHPDFEDVGRNISLFLAQNPRGIVVFDEFDRNIPDFISELTSAIKSRKWIFKPRPIQKLERQPGDIFEFPRQASFVFILGGSAHDRSFITTQPFILNTAGTFFHPRENLSPNEPTIQIAVLASIAHSIHYVRNPLDAEVYSELAKRVAKEKGIQLNWNDEKIRTRFQNIGLLLFKLQTLEQKSMIRPLQQSMVWVEDREHKSGMLHVPLEEPTPEKRQLWAQFLELVQATFIPE